MKSTNQLPLFDTARPARPEPANLAAELAAFDDFGQPTRETATVLPAGKEPSRAIRTFTNEFWTAKQRAAHSLHEISYRACFKPQLPRFFIARLSRPGDIVYDPFMGRGTTLIEAALLGRVPFGCDVNPLSQALVRPRLNPPTITQVSQRLAEINFNAAGEAPQDLLVFYHPETLREIAALRKYLLDRRGLDCLDPIDEWIAMVGLNRLTGHSPGFFSVYTLPPNQAASVTSQKRINERRQQVPPRRDVPRLILAKTRDLLADCDTETRACLGRVAPQARLHTRPAASTAGIPSGSVSLVVTSPPFLDVVNYALDNWLRCWFLGVDAKTVTLTVPRAIDRWALAMAEVFCELQRVLRRGGHVAFEVGEVRKGTVRLEDVVLPCGVAAGLEPVLVLINAQDFTKTANCWGVANNAKGTNSNRVVLFHKP